MVGIPTPSFKHIQEHAGVRATEPMMPKIKLQFGDFDTHNASGSIRDTEQHAISKDQADRNVAALSLPVLDGNPSVPVRHTPAARLRDAPTEQHQHTDADAQRMNEHTFLQLPKQSASSEISLFQPEAINFHADNSTGQVTESAVDPKAPSCGTQTAQLYSEPRCLDGNNRDIGRLEGYTEFNGPRAPVQSEAHNTLARPSHTHDDNITATSQVSNSQQHRSPHYHAPHSQPLTGLVSHHREFNLTIDSLYFGKVIHVDSIANQPWTDRPAIITGVNETARRVRVFLMYSFKVAGGLEQRFGRNERRMREYVLVDHLDCEDKEPKEGHLGTPVVRLSGGSMRKRGWIDTSRVLELPLDRVSAQSIGGVFQDVFLPLDQMKTIKTHIRALGNSIFPSPDSGRLTNYKGPWDGYREYTKE